MKLIGTIHRFNSGRLYNNDGQPITWAIIELESHKRVVAFIDHARMIEQVIDVHVGNSALLTDAWVLNAYDNFHYHYGPAEVAFLRMQMQEQAS